MADVSQVPGSFAGLEVTEAAVPAAQAEALEGLCVEVARVHAGGGLEPAGFRGGIAVARELADRLRTGTVPPVRSRTRWMAFLVCRADGGLSLVVEDDELRQALELRLAASGRFAAGAWRGGGAAGEAPLLAFRVTSVPGGYRLLVTDGRTGVDADLGPQRIAPFAEEPGRAGDAWTGILSGLLAVSGRTAVVEPPTVPSPTAAPSKPAAPPASAGQGWVLLVTAGATVGTRFPLADAMVIGRARSAAVQLDVSSVSRRQAEVRRSATGWTLADLGSANGTWVNGARLGSAQELRVGDRIQVGEVALVVESPDDIGGLPTVLDQPVQKSPGR